MTYTYTQSQLFQKSECLPLECPLSSSTPTTMLGHPLNDYRHKPQFQDSRIRVPIARLRGSHRVKPRVSCPGIPRRLFGLDERGRLCHCGHSTWYHSHASPLIK